MNISTKQADDFKIAVHQYAELDKQIQGLSPTELTERLNQPAIATIVEKVLPTAPQLPQALKIFQASGNKR